jgi:hypothetical protein
VRHDAKTAGCDHDAILLGDQNHVKGGGFLAAPLLVQTGGGKNFKWSGEVQYLYFRKNQNTGTLAMHHSSTSLLVV